MKASVPTAWALHLWIVRLISASGIRVSSRHRQSGREEGALRRERAPSMTHGLR